MQNSSSMIKKAGPPVFLFATSSLRMGAGGIAELSRQVFRTLLDMHHNQLIILKANILEESRPAPGDDLFAANDMPALRWCSGSRLRFALGIASSSSDLQLFDHVGLARLQGLDPLRRGRYLLLIHSVEMWKTTRRDYARTAHRASMLIANSGYTKRKTREHYPDLPPIQVCWPGKDMSVHTNNHEDAVVSGLGPHAMLIVGRLDAAQRHKGHDHLLESLPRVLQLVPDAQLVIAGAGNDRRRLETKARDLGVAKSVIFTGWADESTLSALYRQCALFVMPSEGDGFGIVFLEAMMHRLPCVGLQGSAAEEIFEDGVSGMLVDRDDYRDLADSLTGLLLDAAKRENIGLAGNERYQNAFTGRHYSERLESVLREQLVRPMPSG
jgi:phosphatidylinositol alpha-1,6-mannosyltransferase